MKKMFLFLMAAFLLLSFSVCAAEGDKALYDKAYSLYEKQQYYNAYDLFIQSQYGDWERMANKCIRRWPKNGELWHDNTQWLKDVQLTFRVEQPNDVATFVKIFKDQSLISQVFIGGAGEVTVGLPGNQTYTITDGVGYNWFGSDDAFGPEGAYETMLFGTQERGEIYLMQRKDYLITMDVDVQGGEIIGSEDAAWESFIK